MYSPVHSPVHSPVSMVQSTVQPMHGPQSSFYTILWESRSDQRRLDTRHRTRDYFVFQWPLIEFCAYETGVDHAK